MACTGLCRNAVPTWEMKNVSVPGLRTQPIPVCGVAAQRLGGAGVQRHQPFSVEFGVPDPDHPVGEVDVRTHKAERFADAHAADAEQPEQGLVGRRPQRRVQLPCGLHQSPDLAPVNRCRA